METEGRVVREFTLFTEMLLLTETFFLIVDIF